MGRRGQELLACARRGLGLTTRRLQPAIGAFYVGREPADQGPNCDEQGQVERRVLRPGERRGARQVEEADQCHGREAGGRKPWPEPTEPCADHDAGQKQRHWCVVDLRREHQRDPQRRAGSEQRHQQAADIGT